MIEIRLRRILFLTISASLVLIYVVWWVTYASTHQGERFIQLPPGRAAESPDAYPPQPGPGARTGRRHGR